MSGNITTNTTSLINQEIYSDRMLMPIHDKLLSDAFAVDYSEFRHGDQVNVSTVGEAIVVDGGENKDPDYHPITTGRFQMTIDNYKESANYITTDQLEDGIRSQRLMSDFAAKEARAILETYETSLLGAQDQQTASDLNAINGAPHRFVASAADDILSLKDFAFADYALTEANIPKAGRLAIIDPFSAMQLDLIPNIQNISNNPGFEQMITKGFRKDMDVIRSINGFTVLVSTRLAAVASETIDSDTVTNAKACMFMSIADDQTKPISRAWRRMPTTNIKFNMDKDRHEFITRAKWGRGLQRPDGLVVALAATPVSGFEI